jgi:serine/threonine protein kinase
MGKVHRATQLSLQRPVAVKLLHVQGTEQKRLSAFHRESRSMAALAHPHVVTIHDCGRVAESYYLVMEYLDGSNLRSRMVQGQPWPLEDAARTIDAVAEGLSHIHHQGILHLDLKPENVLCNSSGTLKITDFGLASPHVDAHAFSAEGGSVGTLDYCSPEQRHALPVNERSDVFSLATLAYELLTGELPSRVYVPVSERNSKLPRALDEVLRRGLARDADERYATVDEFRERFLNAIPKQQARGTHWPLVAVCLAFQALLLVLIMRTQVVSDGGQISAHGVPTAMPPRKSFLASPVEIAGRLLYSRIQEKKGKIILVNLDGSEPKTILEDGDSNTEAVFSPDGSKIAFVKKHGGDLLDAIGSNIWVMNADGTDLKQLTHADRYCRTPTWSPDGRQIAFAVGRADRNNEIYVMEADGSNPKNLTRDPGYDADPAWSPDGKQIAFASRRGPQRGFHLHVMDADGKNVRMLSQSDNEYGAVYPAWTPDSARIVYKDTPSNDDAELTICNRDGSDAKRLPDMGLCMRPAWSPDGKSIVFFRVGYTKRSLMIGSLIIVDSAGEGQAELLSNEEITTGSRVVWKP